MPELPEVETVVRLLRPRLVGSTIAGARVGWLPMLGGMSARAFRERVRGARVARVWRRAKFIVIDLERAGRASGSLVGHLRMTGRMHVEPHGWDPGPHARLALELADGRSFHFIDVRKFGRLVFAAESGGLLSELGPEPLGPGFTPVWLHEGLRRRRRMLKPLLLDQSFLAGLGNIYVDEALHEARLHPRWLSHRIGRREAERLHGSIRSTLRAAIERGGSSFDDFYRNPEGQPGEYQEEFRVYGREGLPCLTCGRPIVRIVVAQRGTHLCRWCQSRSRFPELG